MQKLTPDETLELHDLYDKLLTLATNDEVYRAWVVIPIDEAAQKCDLDALRVYFNLSLCPGFTSAVMSVTYAKYAIDVLRRKKGYRSVAGLLTSEVLHAFQAVIKSRQEHFDDQKFLLKHGNDKLLLLLVENPKLESVMLHLISDRKVIDADELIEQATANTEYSLPLHHGAL